MSNILYVGLGGIFGAILRYEISRHIKENRDFIVPVETFLINTMGAFLLNILSNPKVFYIMNNDIRLFLLTGFIGAFTTYSTFSHETISLLRQKHYLHAFLYSAMTVIIGLLGAFFGYYVGNIF
ncbi:fluoride efflux transporter CrcB [Thermoanaerobacterium sp. RBIITD]|uniref:fluoride efflux transporter CrcB n=1 Tax=Thermoanaerobacterium sp. RBIITD TaxID=1550240 RepID=UPI000BB8E2E9|nr:fluoride efflux transporter CrcB [Thermoanaerobacterium sp. RBIITD]